MKFRDTLLLVCGGAAERADLRAVFEDNYNLLEAGAAEQAMLLLSQNQAYIAAILTDTIKMLQQLSARPEYQAIPALFLLPPGNADQEEEAFRLGAGDVVHMPCNPYVLLRRTQIMHESFRRKYNLDALVEEHAKTLRETNDRMVGALSNIIEYRSMESGQHILRIRGFTRILLRDVAKSYPEYGLTPETIDMIASASALHDIGKVSIPDAILNKPGHLTKEEFEVMKTHSAVGAQMLENMKGVASETYLRYAYNICRYHHERWDGRGYPDGLKGDEIPICAQAVSVADVFDALTSNRVYKPPYPPEQAIGMILNGECGVFSPRLLESFKHVRYDFTELAQAYADGKAPEAEDLSAPLPGPEKREEGLNTLQLSQAKYLTVLHYLDAMVLEVDLNLNIFHMVYNPSVDFNLKYIGSTFTGFVDEMLDKRVHPEDCATIRELFEFSQGEFFEQGLWKATRRCRLYSSQLGAYMPHEVTIMRINLENPDQRGVLVITRPTEQILPAMEDAALEESMLRGMFSSVLRCRSNQSVTILEGGEQLLDLLGYTEQEIRDQFHNSLVELILPEDRGPALAAFGEALARSNNADIECRMLRKGGQPIWVLGRYRRMTGADGLEHLVCALDDNSQAHRDQDQIKRLLERHEIILRQSDDIIFEWDLVRDTLEYSGKWEELFGYSPISSGLLHGEMQNVHIHPDDIPGFRDVVEHLFSNREDSVETELRIANARAQYLWCRLRASVQRDGDGRPLKAVGVIANVDSAKRATIALQQRAQLDALTGLLNQSSAQEQAKESLRTREHEQAAALVLLDLDNFRQINDRYGHLFGDAALSQAAHALRYIFRKHDIIGRIGGDEFLIYIPDVPGEELVREKCRQLTEALGRLKLVGEEGCRLSCSVGAALAPIHGSAYPELFTHAAEALYHAKGRGKNGYVIYNRDEAASYRQAPSATPIDSDERPEVTGQGLIHYVFERLYEADDLDAIINDVLALVGREANASRAYIFENSEDNTACSNTYEWCSDGIPPEIHNLRNVEYAAHFPNWPERFDENGIFYIPDVETLPPEERDQLRQQGIRSMLHCAIMDRGVFRGFVGFDECISNRLWTQPQVELLSFLARILSLFLLKKRAQERGTLLTEELGSILDNQEAWIYVIDPDFRIRYMNARARELIPEIEPGRHCYDALMRKPAPCEGCPARNIDKNHTSSAIMENQYLGMRLRCDATLIRWGGQDACLVNCRRAEES